MGKSLLVTGGTSGIGLELVKSYLKDDVHITLILRDIDKAKVCFSYHDMDKVSLIEADLMDPISLSNILKNNLKIAPDYFVYCAGMLNEVSLKRTTYSSFIKLMNVNFFSFVEILRYLISIKSKNTAMRIVAMSSLASLQGGKGNQMYAASKSAMDSFIRTSSHELRENNIVINSIQAGYVDTNMCDSLRLFYGDRFDDFIRQNQPLGLIEKTEIVEQIRFMLSKKGNSVTGVSLKINGGAPC